MTMLLGTLGRYLAARFVRTILAVFLTVFALVYTLDFLELMRRAGDAEGATPLLMARLSLLRTPAVAEQVFPFAILFGAMAVLLQLSRKGELVVARAAGISAWQFLGPGLLAALIIGVLSITVYNPVSASLKGQAAKLETQIFARKSKGSGTDLFIQQRSVDGSAIVRADANSGITGQIADVTIFAFDGSGRFVERVEAPEGTLHEGYWEFRDATVTTTFDEPRTYATYLLATNLDASQVRQSFTPPDSVSFWRLPDAIERSRSVGLDASRYRLQYVVLLARPLLFVAMVFVAASVSLRFFRFGGVSRMVLGGVAAGFLLYVVTMLMRDLGGAGIVSPAVAGWLPAVGGSLLGTLALLYQEDG